MLEARVAVNVQLHCTLLASSQSSCAHSHCVVCLCSIAALRPQLVSSHRSASIPARSQTAASSTGHSRTTHAIAIAPSQRTPDFYAGVASQFRSPLFAQPGTPRFTLDELSPRSRSPGLGLFEPAQAIALPSSSSSSSSANANANAAPAERKSDSAASAPAAAVKWTTGGAQLSTVSDELVAKFFALPQSKNLFTALFAALLTVAWYPQTRRRS